MVQKSQTTTFWMVLKPCKKLYIYHINWCRIFSINCISDGLLQQIRLFQAMRVICSERLRVRPFLSPGKSTLNEKNRCCKSDWFIIVQYKKLFGGSPLYLLGPWYIFKYIYIYEEEDCILHALIIPLTVIHSV